MKRETILKELERIARERAAEMEDGDELYITYSVDIVRDGVAVTGEGGERSYAKGEWVGE